MEMRVAQPWLLFLSSVQQPFEYLMLHAAFWAIAGPLVREEQEEHLQYAQDVLQNTMQGNQVQQTNQG